MKFFHDIGEKSPTETKVTLESNKPKFADLSKKEDATTFWNGLFSDMAKSQNSEVTDIDELAFEMLDRYEDEFHFDFEIDDELQAAMDKFESNKWERLSTPERKNAVVEFVDVLSGKLELEDTPKVNFHMDSLGDYGRYNHRGNSIEINLRYLDDPKETMDTLAHELRHAYQYQRAQVCETKVDQIYAFNFDNYISPIEMENGDYMFYTDYQGQYIEAEARAFANLFTQTEVFK